MADWRKLFRAAALLIGLLLVGCAGTPAAQQAKTVPGPTIWVMSSGWHSDIILRRADIPPGRIPETTDYAEARYFAFGWGDARYYPARTPTVGIALRAMATPTPAVMHLTAIPTMPESFYLEAEVLRLPVSAAGLQALIRYIHEGFDRGTNAQALKNAPGLYRHSGFYRAIGRFHMLNTCNTWTARGLIQAGLPVGLSRAIQAEALMRELRPIATGEAPEASPELRNYYYR
jgi:uncharacterized protein (TIGR02117 family)